MGKNSIFNIKSPRREERKRGESEGLMCWVKIHDFSYFLLWKLRPLRQFKVYFTLFWQQVRSCRRIYPLQTLLKYHKCFWSLSSRLEKSRETGIEFKMSKNIRIFLTWFVDHPGYYMYFTLPPSPPALLSMMKARFVRFRQCRYL